jgi:hypothetical protein
LILFEHFNLVASHNIAKVVVVIDTPVHSYTKGINIDMDLRLANSEVVN